MKALLTLRSGERGAKRLVEIYGDTLVYVRYRYDREAHIRVKTAEIVIERTAWEPPPPKFADIDIVPVRISFAESELKQLAKAAGGRWGPDERVWLVPYGKVKGTKLKKHIVSDAMISR